MDDADKTSPTIVHLDVAVNVARRRKRARATKGIPSIYGNSINSLFYASVYVPHTNPTLMGRVNTE